MSINWSQVVATVLANTLVLSVVAYLAKAVIERWLERNLESYRSGLRKGEVEHETKFALLHETRAAAIAELYRLLVELLRRVNSAAQGVHQYADDQVPTPRQVRVEMATGFYNSAVEGLRAFRRHFEESRIYFSDELIDKVGDLLAQVHSVFEDLEISLSPNPPDVEPPPSIAAIWQAQKKLRLLVQPLRVEVETEFRRILGVLDEGEGVKSTGGQSA